MYHIPYPSALRRRYARRRCAVIVCVVVIHLGLFWLVANLRPVAWVANGHELQVNLISPNLGPREPFAPSLDWQFQQPEDVVVPEPDITITPDQEAGEGIVADAITQRLAPRLDPTHLNVRPSLAGSFSGTAAASSLMLRVLVEADGSVGNAEVVRSAGDAEADRTAINFVMANWRFLPASVNGKPIEAWMTVIVRFATGQAKTPYGRSARKHASRSSRHLSSDRA
jgi:TonB family protein